MRCCARHRQSPCRQCCSGSKPVMNTYTAFGITFGLPFRCPELQALTGGSGALDVLIDFGEVPTALPSPSLVAPFFQRNARSLLMSVPGVASFLVEDGTRITISPDRSATDETIRLFLFDSVLAALLQQRRIAPL